MPMKPKTENIPGVLQPNSPAAAADPDNAIILETKRKQRESEAKEINALITQASKDPTTLRDRQAPIRSSHPSCPFNTHELQLPCGCRRMLSSQNDEDRKTGGDAPERVPCLTLHSLDAACRRHREPPSEVRRINKMICERNARKGAQLTAKVGKTEEEEGKKEVPFCNHDEAVAVHKDATTHVVKPQGTLRGAAARGTAAAKAKAAAAMAKDLGGRFLTQDEATALKHRVAALELENQELRNLLQSLQHAAESATVSHSKMSRDSRLRKSMSKWPTVDDALRRSKRLLKSSFTSVSSTAAVAAASVKSPSTGSALWGCSPNASPAGLRLIVHAEPQDE